MAKIITLKIDKKLEGKKVEAILEKELGFSRSLIGKLKRMAGALSLDGKDVKMIDKVYLENELSITLDDSCKDSVIATNIPLDILYEDEDIIAVNKPHSMPVHPSGKNKDRTLANAVYYYLGHSSHIITRLDKDTTGVVLIAKNPHTAHLLTNSIKNGEIEKVYTAVINGVLSPKEGEIRLPIARSESNGMIRVVDKRGKEALSFYKTLLSNGELSVVKLIPVTGRTHQLRVHMSHLKCPIYGDNMYGAPQINERCRLHCGKISLRQPQSGEKLEITAEYAADFIPEMLKRGRYNE